MTTKDDQKLLKKSPTVSDEVLRRVKAVLKALGHEKLYATVTENDLVAAVTASSPKSPRERSKRIQYWQATAKDLSAKMRVEEEKKKTTSKTGASKRHTKPSKRVRKTVSKKKVKIASEDLKFESERR
jgi:hypothetical protein